MKPDSRFKAGVPKPLQDSQNSAAAQLFVVGAPGKAVLPWQEPPKRVTVYVNTSQPETLMLQIDYIAYHTRRTKRDIIESALREYATKTLIELGADPEIPAQP